MARLVFLGDSSMAWLCLDLCLALSPNADSFPSSAMASQSYRIRDAGTCPGFISHCCLPHGTNTFLKPRIVVLYLYHLQAPSSLRLQSRFTTYFLVNHKSCVQHLSICFCNILRLDASL
ncbi:hypothetical protein LY78DRAFT_435935 [Colletotrichum sublineola]|nr:hypothetical protein LY78DRAFT_435935 [Colletotrichum sublineola]